MYYQNHYQGKSIISSSRMPIPSERHSYLRDSGLILSTDAKPRLKWTQDLHERFVEAVNQLGGGDKATPKTIMKVMGIQGLTLYHLKSHLQKYRLSKNLNGQSNNSFNKTSLMTMVEENTPEVDESHSESLSFGPQPNMNLPISNALQMQIEVQRRLHEQLEVQRNLQLRIEAQGKYLQSILEKAQETLGRQNIGASEIEATKAQLSQLVSKVSSQYHPNSSFLEHKQLQMLENNRLGLRTYIGDSTSEQKEEPFFHRMKLTWPEQEEEEEEEEEEGLRENNRTYLPTMVNKTEPRTSYSRRSPGRLSIGVGLHEHRGGSSNSGYSTEERFNENGEACKLERCNQTSLDLNTNDGSYGTTCPKQFDLNGFSWN